MKLSGFAVVLGTACLLAACNGNSGALDASRFENPVFGASVRNNIAVQSVPADPAKLGAPVRADGARQSLAQARYETDRVKPPPSPQTSSVGGDSGSGSGSASGSGASTSGGGN
jgi:hypothetical protein